MYIVEIFKRPKLKTLDPTPNLRNRKISTIFFQSSLDADCITGSMFAKVTPSEQEKRKHDN